MCCHDGEIGIHPCVSFMKISGADTGQVAKPCSDMYQLGVDFQTFHSEYHFDSCLLHAFAPADVGRFVETGEQFDDNRYFFRFVRRRSELSLPSSLWPGDRESS